MHNIQKLVDAITEKDNQKCNALINEKSEELKKEIGNATKNQIESIAAQLLQESIDMGFPFYESIWSIYEYIGNTEILHSIIERIWIYSFNSANNKSKRDLLFALFEENNYYLWQSVPILSYFCINANIPVEIAYDWFPDLIIKTLGDLANSYIHAPIENYVLNHLSDSVSILEKYLHDNIKDSQLDFSVLIWGILKVKSIQKEFNDTRILKIDSLISNSTTANIKICKYRSNQILLSHSLITLDKAIDVIDSIIQSNIDNVEAFFIARNFAIIKKEENEFVGRILHWFLENIEFAQSENSKYQIVDVLWRIFHDKKIKDEIGDTIEQLFIKIQPIPLENNNTWRNIRIFLIEQLKINSDLFEKCLLGIINTNPAVFLKILNSHEYENFCIKLLQAKKEYLITRMLFSFNKYERGFSFIVLKNKITIQLTTDELKSVNKVQLELFLLELIKNQLPAERIAIYLPQVEKYYITDQTLSLKFKEFIFDQGINYCSACYEKWKKLTNISPEFKEILGKIDEYFTQFQNLFKLSANSFSFSFYNKAVKSSNDEFSRLIQKETNEHSVFLNLIRNLSIIYGKQWAIFKQGKIGKKENFHEFQEEMEVPRLEFIDPEGMTLKRIKANARLLELERQ